MGENNDHRIKSKHTGESIQKQNWKSLILSMIMKNGYQNYQL